MSSADIFEYRPSEYRIVRVYAWKGVMIFKRAMTNWCPIPAHFCPN